MAYNSNRGLDDYVSVHQRIEQFRKEHPTGRILTAIASSDPLVFRAEVYLSDSEVPNAIAHASEEGGMGQRGKSAVEKTETAAVGRALAFCGYEIKQGIASREEMQKANTPTTRSTPQSMPHALETLNPEEQHKELDHMIVVLCDDLGYSATALQKWIAKNYETDGGLDGLSVETKKEIVGRFIRQRNEVEQAV